MKSGETGEGPISRRVCLLPGLLLGVCFLAANGTAGQLREAGRAVHQPEPADRPDRTAGVTTLVPQPALAE